MGRRRAVAIFVKKEDRDEFQESYRYALAVEQAIQFLETKVHGILGVGSESTDIIYNHLKNKFNANKVL